MNLVAGRQVKFELHPYLLDGVFLGFFSLDCGILETLPGDVTIAADKAIMMGIFQRELSWPAWVGTNWDALADRWMGPERREARPYALSFFMTLTASHSELWTVRQRCLI